LESLSIERQICNSAIIITYKKNTQQIVGYDWIIIAIQELVQEDLYSADDEDNVPLLVEEMVEEEQRDEGVVVEDNRELANLLLQLGEVVESMLEDEEEEDQAQ
jgi:hypothetical protein